MSDKVTPLPAGEGPRLGTSNGFGRTMMGLTRTDGSGRCFGTRWLTAFALPLVPLERYYLTEGETTYTSQGVSSTSTTRYQIAGVASLRIGEIIRTYLYCWLFAPILGGGPLLLLLLNADSVANSIPGGIFLFLVLIFVVLFASVLLVVIIHGYYRRHWAPLREPEWF